MGNKVFLRPCSLYNCYKQWPGGLYNSYKNIAGFRSKNSLEFRLALTFSVKQTLAQWVITQKHNSQDSDFENNDIVR